MVEIEVLDPSKVVVEIEVVEVMVAVALNIPLADVVTFSKIIKIKIISNF